MRLRACLIRRDGSQPLFRCFFVFFSFLLLDEQNDIWINEFHYDNLGTDVGEFIEIAYISSLSLAGYKVVGYNGNGGATYGSEIPLDDPIGIVGNTVNGITFKTFTLATNGIQNGAPDGLALVDPSNAVLEFISYEGAFTATSGPANGLTSVDIGVQQSGATLQDYSLQRVGSGCSSVDFASWQGPIPNTKGAVNTGQTIENCVSGSGGDPHFKTWHKSKFDYHGQCDLELAADPTFADGLGLTVFIRTQIRRQWSFIQATAIRIGDDTLEVQGGMDGNHYWFNKEYQGVLKAMGGNFPVSYKKANSKSRSYVIDLGSNGEGPRSSIEIRTYKDFVRVNFSRPTKQLFGNTVGLLGDYVSGKKLARDGVTVIEDDNEFGQEWQVQPGSPQLFHDVSGPQAPLEKCLLPSNSMKKAEKERRRRLGEATVIKSQAEAACEKAGVPKSDIESCVYDVLATEDVDMAGSY